MKQWNEILKPDNVPAFYGLKHLTPADFRWDWLPPREPYDIVFTRGFYRNFSMKTPTVIWCVIPQECPHVSPHVLEYWTNSDTTRKGLVPKAYVVIPPHDYSDFRVKREKDLDVVAVVRGNELAMKGAYLFARVVKKLKLEKALLITTVASKSELLEVQKLGIPFVYNLPRSAVAEYLTRAKVFALPSYKESCPLTIYEALNSRCIVVARDVGAVKEQLGDLGFAFKDDSEFLGMLKTALSHTIDETVLVERGLLFDRVTVGATVTERLRQIEEVLS
ncbi:MAG: glycosyltransferase [Candidatus Diapherotrites archaeon]|nr:glycosyltransferase [Candidatus Diapherotrites archaeon]